MIHKTASHSACCEVQFFKLNTLIHKRFCVKSDRKDTGRRRRKRDIMEREQFKSRLGFIFVSAGCAIGLGNVWKFPYMAGRYGGGVFILFYLLFLLLLATPIMVCEFAVGRAAGKSTAKSFDMLEPKGTRWHRLKWLGIAGNYLLMMFYSTVAAWVIYYAVHFALGSFEGADTQAVTAFYENMTGSPATLLVWTWIVVALGFFICGRGLQNGVERSSTLMMSGLLIIMVLLAANSLFMDGAEEGVRFYLLPDFSKIRELGLGNIIYGAMSQSFFTLSVGMGGMSIFGSYLKKEQSLAGEAVVISALDTFVALMAGMIIIPACFAFDIEPTAGPPLIFMTLPNIFVNLPAGRLVGTAFFIFLSFAALTTIIGVYENIISYGMDLFGFSRRQSTRINAAAMAVLVLPCIFGFNLLKGIEPLGAGSTIMDAEDFLVSNNLLPLGAMVFVLFCTARCGWGWKAFIKEADTGKGMKFPAGLRGYMALFVPLIISVIYLKGYYDMFVTRGTGLFIFWMCVAAAFLLFIFLTSSVFRKKS